MSLNSHQKFAFRPRPVRPSFSDILLKKIRITQKLIPSNAGKRQDFFGRGHERILNCGPNKETILMSFMSYSNFCRTNSNEIISHNYRRINSLSNGTIIKSITYFSIFSSRYGCHVNFYDLLVNTKLPFLALFRSEVSCLHDIMFCKDYRT